MLNVNAESPTLDKSRPPGQDFSEALDLFFGNWVWRAVHALIEHPKFNPSPKWIADTLMVSVDEAVDALDGLTELGLIARDGERVSLKSPQFIVPAEKQTRDYAFTKHKQVSQQVLAKSEASNVASAFSFLLAVSEEQLKNLVSRFASESGKLDKEKDLTKKDVGLFSLTLTCTNMAPSLKGGQ